jgi:hypothetical protein
MQGMSHGPSGIPPRTTLSDFDAKTIYGVRVGLRAIHLSLTIFKTVC